MTKSIIAKRHLIRKRHIKRVCPFCQAKTEPDYKDVEPLSRVMTERGKIIDRGNSDLCNRHQRMLTIAIKRARYIALLPFVVRPR